MIDTIRNMKKVELHLHLDGSVSIDTAASLLEKNRAEVEKEMVANDKCLNLTEYLTKFDLPISIMQTRENLVKIASDLVDYLEGENVIYAEVRFAPIFHIKEGLKLNEVVEAVLEGLKSNEKVKTNLILCMMRGMDYDTNLSIINLASEYLGKGVCAIDLAGDECKYPLDEYVSLFEIANIKGIPFTIHAGEAGSAIEVRKAIEIGTTRIGHGVHAVEDDYVLDLLKKRNVLLEVCPTSNVQTDVCKFYNEHPIRELYKKGVKVCVNTDNKTVSKVSISDEYVKLYQNFDFTIDDFKLMNKNALKSSFLKDEEKQELLKEFD